MHREHRHAHIDHVRIEHRHLKSNRTSAALIHLAQLTNLPYNIIVIEDPADPAQKNSADASLLPPFTARAGIFGNTDSAIQIGGIVRLKSIGIIGVIGRGHVGGKTVGL